MRAAVTYSAGKIEISEVAEPKPGERQVLVQVAAVGLCGSDVHFYLGSDPYASFPRVQGHEFSGIVLEAPEPRLQTDPVAGDLVAVEPLLPCGTCYACRRGLSNCCMSLRVLGVHVDGALAERIAVRSSAVHVANDVTPELAALVEPLSIGVHACRRALVASGDRVVVFGAGAIGQAVLLAALERGAKVLVVDQLAARLELSTSLGAERVVDASKQETTEEVRAWTDSDGADVVFEATGSPTVLRQCVVVAAHGARVVVLGTPNNEAPFPVLEITRKELNILGSRNGTNCFQEALGIVRSRPQEIARLITQRFSLDEVERALQFASDHPDLTEKIMITVD